MSCNHCGLSVEECVSKFSVIGTKLDNLIELVGKQNGRVGKLEEDVNSLKVRFAYWAGGISVLVVITNFVMSYWR